MATPVRSVEIRLWRIFGVVFVVHFVTLVGVFVYAMSWSLTTPKAVPISVRMATADALLAVLSFPLSAIIAAFPDVHIEGYAGWLPYVAVSVL